MMFAHSFVVQIVHNVVDAVINSDRDTNRAAACVSVG